MDGVAYGATGLIASAFILLTERRPRRQLAWLSMSRIHVGARGYRIALVGNICLATP